jgi:hypothetical protein
MSKDKVEDYEGFTSEDAERSLEGPLSEDLPENIDEIEQAVCWELREFKESEEDTKEKLKLYKEGRTDELERLQEKQTLSKAELGKQLGTLLKKAKIKPTPGDWDLGELAQKIIHRRWMGKTKADVVKAFREAGGEGEKTESPSLEDMLNEGKTFLDLIETEVDSDCPDSQLEFLLLVEKKKGIEIKTPKELSKVAGLSTTDPGYIEGVFYSAKEELYKEEIARLLDNGSKYKDLLNVDPKSFYLPKTWKNCDEEEMSQERVISSSLFFSFFSEEGLHGRPISYRDVAERLEAPLSVILKAARYYDGL